MDRYFKVCNRNCPCHEGANYQQIECICEHYCGQQIENSYTEFFGFINQILVRRVTGNETDMKLLDDIEDKVIELTTSNEVK